MKKIVPFENLREAHGSLDNGGRFYNLLTKANDGHITVPELGKVAGVFSDKQQMVLYFAMSTAALPQQEKAQLEASLSDDLKRAYQQYVPQQLLPSEAETKAALSSSAIITGIPRHVEAKAEFNGFIMVPIMAGKVTTFTMIPIIDQYDVYELRDHARDSTFLIAHARGAGRLPETKIRVGGVLKELKLKEGEKDVPKKFLEALYYADIA